MKKFTLGVVCGLLVGLILAATSLGLAASTIRLIINGEEIKPDVPPQIIKGRLMVPAKFIAEPLGATVEWDGVTKTVRVTARNQVSKTATSGNVDSSPLRRLKVTYNNVLQGISDQDDVLITQVGDIYAPSRLIWMSTGMDISFDSKTYKITFVNSQTRNELATFQAVLWEGTVTSPAIYDHGLLWISLNYLNGLGLLDFQLDEPNKSLTILNRLES